MSAPTSPRRDDACAGAVRAFELEVLAQVLPLVDRAAALRWQLQAARYDVSIKDAQIARLELELEAARNQRQELDTALGSLDEFLRPVHADD